MSLELLILGSGTSAGVPMIGCDCDVCTSDDPRNNRTRSSAVIAYPDAADPAVTRRLLIDAAPDIRIQMTRERINTIDGVLITHTHADHIFGIDDLRRFNAVMQKPIDVYAEPTDIETLKRIFAYIFDKHHNINPSFVADLLLQPVAVGRSLDLFGATWTPLPLLHGRQPVLGYRIDRGAASIGYCTDVSSIPPQSYPLLADLDVLIIDALRYRHHPTHMTVNQAIEQIDQLRPKQAYLTHIAHDIEHTDLDARLPDGVNLAYDGLRVDVACGVERTTSETFDDG